MRKESRGLHTTLDYPRKDDRLFHKDSIVAKDACGGDYSGLE